MKKQKPQEIQLTHRKKRIFFIVMLSLPFLFFLGLELGLRLYGYGPDLSLFRRQEIRHQNFLTINPSVKFRYFGTMKFSPSTSIDYFQIPKPPGVFRIFCLGGSTTVGYPFLFNGSFASYLRDRLHYTFPYKKIEVINLGMTATNSFTVLDIARELPAYKPDLLIVYDGHNEFYGALGAASHQSLGYSRMATLLYMRLIHLKTFQLVRDAVQKVAGLFRSVDNSESRGTVMETLAHGQYVPIENRTYWTAHDIFRRNMEDLKINCASTGIPLILGTQVSNLRDMHPFVSEHPVDFPQEQIQQFKQFFENGEALQMSRHIDSAITAYRSAEKLDSMYAEVHYRLAQCYEANMQTVKALGEYRLARDEDELRFRADSRFNQLIRSMEEPGFCYVADHEKIFQSISHDSLIGHNLIVEHLHPNSDGYFLLAKDYARVMQAQGILATPQEWKTADTVNENILWDRRCVTDLDEEIAKQNTAWLTSSWPFKNQLPKYEPVPATDTIRYIAQQVVMNQIDWKRGHEQAVTFYIHRGDLNNAVLEYQALLGQIPLDLELYMNLSRVYFRGKNYSGIKATMLRSIEVYPMLQSYRTLGDVMMQNGDATEALQYYERMDDFSQNPNERIQNGLALSYAYFKSGKLQKARTRLLGLLEINPRFQPARQMLDEVTKELEKEKIVKK
jgi:tetratricopeptide (TPR) repeat protein